MPPRSLRGLTTCSTRRRPKPKRANVRCCTSSNPRSISIRSPMNIPSVARTGLAATGRGRTLLRLCADHGRTDAVRTGDVLPFRGLSERCDQEARTDTSRQGGGSHEARALSAGQHRTGLLRLSRQRRDRCAGRGRGEGCCARLRLYGRGRFRPPVVGHPRPEGERPPTATTVRRLRRVWAKSVCSAIRTIGATRSIASFWP